MRQAVPLKPKTSTVIMSIFSKTVGIILFAATLIIALIMAVSFYSYHPEDPAWSSAKDTDVIHNMTGEKGAYFSDIMLSAIGNTVWLFPILMLGFGYQLFIKRKILTISLDVISFRLLGVLIAIFSLSALLDLHSGNGGMMGGFIGTELITIISNTFPIDPSMLYYFTKIFFALLALVGFYLITGMGPIGWADACGAAILKVYYMIFPKHDAVPQNRNSHLPNHDGNIEQSTIDRMLADGNERKAPSFFNKIFSSKEEAQDTPRSSEFIEIDESLLKEDEYETNAPIQDPNFNSYSYSPLESEDQSTDNEATMNNNSKSTIPPIFRNLQKDHENNTAEVTPQNSDNLKIDALSSEVDESWDNFIRAPKPAMPAEDQNNADHSGSSDSSHSNASNTPEEKKGIPSIFKNLFKARRKKRADIEESIEKREPSIADAVAPVAINAFTDSTASEPSHAFVNEYEAIHPSNDAQSVAHTTIQPQAAPVHIENSDLQFSISDDFDNHPQEIEAFEYMPEDFPEKVIEKSMESVTENFAGEDDFSSSDEQAHATAQNGMLDEATITNFGGNVSSSLDVDSDIEVDIDVESPINTITNSSQTEAPAQKFIGHEIDPRTGMPIPIKAPKEYPMAGRLPGLDLLGNPPPVTESYDTEQLQELAGLIEDQFKNFNIEVSVVNIEPGPVITRFELDLAPGVKIAQINNLNKDIARALSVTSVRIVEIIPGKPYIGLEIPNKKRQTVYFKEGLYADAYRNSKHPLTILLGKDVSGNQVVANLKDMPHLLIAGTTGSGKSVGINTIILSLLYKAHPDDLRLIMIDPKMLELSVYEDIPHLLAPVVTDMKESANALRWAVMEMERRYLLMSKLRVRNITGFNQTVKAALQKGEPIADPLWDAAREVSDHVKAPDLKPLPYIVIIIDELADMMMSVGKAVEELIARLTQKARAAGIHLVVATQRPSVDVITGLIKANIPSRIAFQVSSKIDSRTVLDQQGAENLLGNGDMLFFPTGSSFPLRVHGAFVDDNEVNRVTDFLRLTGPTDYIEDMLKDPQEEIPGLSDTASGYVPNPDDIEDVLYDEAVKIVLEDQRPTISYVQRKLRIGYQRAARLIEAMEEQGIVSAPANNGNREILVSYEKQ